MTTLYVDRTPGNAAIFDDLQDACNAKAAYLDGHRRGTRTLAVVFSRALNGYIVMVGYESGQPWRVLARRPS